MLPKGDARPADVAVVIPAKDEADRIRDTVTAASGLPGVGLVLVVDDGSRDGTFRAAELAGVFNRIGYPLVVSIGKQLDVVRGDSGSALFLGRIKDANASSVLIGVASAQGSTGASGSQTLPS